LLNQDQPNVESSHSSAVEAVAGENQPAYERRDESSNALDEDLYKDYHPAFSSSMEPPQPDQTIFRDPEPDSLIKILNPASSTITIMLKSSTAIQEGYTSSTLSSSLKS
jgi:hypothetical protein